VESDSRLLVYTDTKKVGVGQSEGRAKEDGKNGPSASSERVVCNGL